MTENNVAKRTTTAIRRLTRLEPFPQPEVINVKYPVVLMHGFGLLAFLTRGGHLHEEAIHLRLQGVRAFAPNISPYHVVPQRASMWKERLEHILSSTKAEKVNLIAHSMGGLDARFLISKLDMHPHVASLTTISTPHRGSSVAQMALQQPEKIRELVQSAANWLGEYATQDETDIHSAVENLTPQALSGSFNDEVPDSEGVLYQSYAGSAGKGTPNSINPIFRPINSWMYSREGVNDGFVSVSSARWGNFLGEIEADHLQQIGIDVLPGSSFSSKEFISGLVTDLGNAGL